MKQEDQIKERRPSIDDKTKLKLWTKSGGRCQYRNCNVNLYQDDKTYADLNKSYIAHIYGWAKKSARYDAVLSPKLEKDFSNLMLLCDACHRKIDHEEAAQHPAPLLIEMKKEHEDRIEMLTSISENVRTNLVFYNAKIGAYSPPMEVDEVRVLLAKNNRFPFKDAIALGPKDTVIQDDSGIFWEWESRSLEQKFARDIEPHFESDKRQHFSLFPFAPMPLLIKLGTLFGDKYQVTTYQRHREPATWAWSDTAEPVAFHLKEPANPSGLPVLNISLSANIDEARIRKAFPNEEISIWMLTIDKPQLDFLKTEAILSDWRVVARQAFSRIKDVHGHDSILHIFPAMPLSAAVEFGRVWMPKVDLPMVIYDGRDEFMKAVEIKRN